MTTQPQEITLTRAISSPPSRVYAAFTTAQGWCEWCSETAEADTRVGGKLHIYTEGYNAYGEFKILEPDKIAAFTWNGDKEPPMLIHITLNEQDHSTLLTFKVTGLCSEQDWADIVEFLERIWGRVLDNLKDVLEAK
jgi:uncharacterized protein YndB with AHSA1/START domain